jgi:hypothetical protein
MNRVFRHSLVLDLHTRLQTDPLLHEDSPPRALHNHRCQQQIAAPRTCATSPAHTPCQTPLCKLFASPASALHKPGRYQHLLDAGVAANATAGGRNVMREAGGAVSTPTEPARRTDRKANERTSTTCLQLPAVQTPDLRSARKM